MLILRNSYNLQITQLGVTSCELSRNASDIRYVNLYDSLNEDDIGSPGLSGLLSLKGFNIINQCLKNLTYRHFTLHSIIKKKSLFNSESRLVNYI